MTDTPLPPLYQGTLDAAGVAALLRDLAACASLVELRVRSRSGRPSDSLTPSIENLTSALADGTTSAVQVAYRYDDKVWVDTLLTSGAPPGGVRVVRMAATGNEPGGGP
ncbi:MAG: hypothetical protein IV100_09680 [Myxococcales bacterium]|nr:hypothetical protein [Myxococcales bacterium]